MAVAADSHRNFLIPEETFPPYLALDNGGFISPTTKRVAPLDEARYLFLCIPIVTLPSPFVNPRFIHCERKIYFTYQCAYHDRERISSSGLYPFHNDDIQGFAWIIYRPKARASHFGRMIYKANALMFRLQPLDNSFFA